MSVILLVLGILLAAAGGALIGFGFPIKELSLGGTAILAGAFAVVGGLLLVGLSAVVSQLARVTAALKGPRTPASAVALPRGSRCRHRRPRRLPASPLRKSLTSWSRRLSRPLRARASRCRPPPSNACVRASRGRTRPRRRPRRRRCRCRLTASTPRIMSSRHRRSSRCRDRRVRLPSRPGSRGSISCSVRARPARRRSSRRHNRRQRSNSLWPKRPAREDQPDPRLEVARAPAAAAAAHPVSAAEVELGTGTGAARAQRRDPQVRRGRRHGLYALRRRFDRGAASAGNGALRIDRRAARAHREQRLGVSAFDCPSSAGTTLSHERSDAPWRNPGYLPRVDAPLAAHSSRSQYWPATIGEAQYRIHNI